MRKDVKIGMLLGTGVCLAAAVWFCVHQQIVEQPRVEDLMSQKKELFATSSVPEVNFKSTERENLIAKNQVILPSAPSTAGEITSAKIHTVQAGETLSDISRIYYGTSGNWKKIYEANKELLSRGPDTVRTGMKLIIPQ
jgi:nucleoid-associated protein YgaU